MLRKSLFSDACDIGNLDLLLQLLETQGLVRGVISNSIHNGATMAALMGDYQ